MASARRQTAAVSEASSSLFCLQREVKVAGFSEADQANLWQNVTDAQSKAKQGLGQGSVLGKVAGVRWQGSKKQISDSDSEVEAPAPSEQLQQHAGLALEQAVILPPKCRSAPDLTAGTSGGYGNSLECRRSQSSWLFLACVDSNMMELYPIEMQSGEVLALVQVAMRQSK